MLNDPDIYYLSEMMNFPGVQFNDEEVHKKLQYCKDAGKPCDGHAPGLTGEGLEKYINNKTLKIDTDHESFTYDEGLEKIKLGMKCLIREGSAAQNFEELIPLIKDHHEMCMFACDDKHPDDLLLGEINTLCKRAVAKGYDVWKVL